MLVNLTIKNIALIEYAEIDFRDGLNILSGETGAGKSVILDSINFVLGAKADRTMIRHGEDFCLVTCLFSDLTDAVKNILNEFDIEFSNDLIIKRKYDVNGNGYIKLNGENITATMLRKVTSHLVDVHGQSEHFSLLSKTKQLECIDSGANTAEIISKLHNIYIELRENEKKLEKLGGDPDERFKRLDILEYQINEIEKAQLKEGEKEELLIQREKINNLEKLHNALQGVLSSLTEENATIDCLLAGEQCIKQISNLGEEYSSILDRIRSCREELDDVADTVDSLISNLDDNNLNIDDIEQRLEVYRNFSRKYGSSVNEVNDYLQKALLEKDSLINFEKNCETLIKEISKQRVQLYEVCLNLSKKRKEFANAFCKNVTLKLNELGMPKAVFYIDFEEIPQLEQIKTFNLTGLDKVEFMFSANAGEPVKPLSKIISGGEMSRFMLALKTQLSVDSATYIFDEIDAGISGITASIVAKQFAQIAKNKQVIAISHLPQIASMADNSLLIEKHEEENKTHTSIKNLSNKEKIEEIVRLIGGSVNDQSAITHASKMLDDAKQYKEKL